MNQSKNQQLSLNLMSSLGVYILGLAVTFFLTPYIVEKLGADTYGFVGLSGTIIGYTGLITMAVGSMAGRFITIKVHEGDFESANKYLSSLFFVNLGLSAIFMVGYIIFAIFMPYFLDVSPKILNDVRILFLLLGLNSCLGLILGIIGIGTFIKNRLDFANIRTAFGQILNSSILIILFTFFKPRIWYYGVAGILMEIYVIVSNYYFFKNLTPELQISRSMFDVKYIKELIASGLWNVVTKLSQLLNKGFDLLLANLFISAYCMGILSLSQSIPVLILSLLGSVSNVFAPELTKLYAKHDFEGMLVEFRKALRITGLLSCLPLCVFFAYGDIFYRLWLPSENSDLLYIISCLGSMGLIFALPLEPLWPIFTITNTVKKSSISLLINSSVVFVLVLLSMLVVKDQILRLYCLAGISSTIGTIRILTFLPMYGAKCLNFNKFIFYPYILRYALNFCIILLLSFVFKNFIHMDSWSWLITGAVFTCVVGVIVSCLILLSKEDINNYYCIVKNKVRTVVFKG